jgi:hypothetical protein
VQQVNGAELIFRDSVRPPEIVRLRPFCRVVLYPLVLHPAEYTIYFFL